MFTTTPRSVLYLSAKELLAVGFNGDTPELLDAFVSDNEGREPGSGGAPSFEEFERWLLQRKHHRFEVLIDSVDEQHHIELLPFLRWGDRQALINRKLRQQFRDSEFTTVNLKKEKIDGKSRISALMMALRGEEQFTPWLDILLKHQVRIEALTSPTLLTEQVVRMIRPGGSGLLVSLNPAGLRQTVVIDGRVRFSRLASLGSDEAPEIQAEVTRTLQYLLMSQRVSRDDIREGAFEVWMIDTRFEKQIGIAEKLIIDQSASVTVRIVDPQQLGIPILAGQTGLSLWLQAPGREKVADYRNARTSRFARLASMRKRLWAGSSLMAALGLIAALAVPWAIAAFLPDTSAQRRALAIVEREGFTLEASMSKFEVSAAEMSATVRNALAIQGKSVRPWALLRAIGQSMPTDPGIRIQLLSWAPIDEGINSGGAAPTPSLDMMTDAAQTQSNVDITQITLAGTVDPKWTKQYANARVEQLAEQIKTHCQCSQIDIQLPYDPSPSVAIAQDYLGDALKHPPFRIVALAPPVSTVRASAGSL